MKDCVVFLLDNQRYAVYLSSVERIVSMVEITPFPKAPEIVIGVINLEGRIIPVVSIRKRFGLPDKETELNDQIIIARTSRRPVAFVADAVTGIIGCSDDEVVKVEQILPKTEYIDGVVKLEDGMVLIHDLEKFLSLEEGDKLDKALNKRPEEKIG